MDGATPEGSTTPDGSTGSDGSMPGVDAAKPLMCMPDETKCVAQGVCAVLAMNADNCGACGHSCGGGKCTGGVCAPAKIFDAPPGDAGTTQIGPIAVGHGLSFFFATTDGNEDNRLYSCPVATGCTTPPKQLVVRQYTINAINSVNAATLTFISAPTQTTEREMIYACSPNGCPGTPISFTGDGLNGIESRLAANGDKLFYSLGGSGPGVATCMNGMCATPTALGNGMTKGTHGFAVDATNIYFVDSVSRGSTIARCAQTDTTCVPTPVVSGDQSSVQSVAAFNGKLYWITPGRDGFVEGKLFSCDLPGCATSKLLTGGLDLSPINSNTIPLEELYVDVSGAYWFTKANKLQRCSLPDCMGGPHDFAGPLLQPHSLVADDQFVYWAETSAVWRLAK